MRLLGLGVVAAPAPAFGGVLLALAQVRGRGPRRAAREAAELEIGQQHLTFVEFGELRSSLARISTGSS